MESESKNIGFMPELHHLRCFAAGLIFISHYLHYFYFRWTPQPKLAVFGLFIEGHTGIGLFFALSGYLFLTIAERDRGEVQYWPFLRNRMLRILPLYTLIFFVALSISPEGMHGANLLDYFLSNLGSPLSSSLITGAAWTISVEFAFYLSFPFLLRFFRAHGARYLWQWVGLLLLFKFAIFLTAERPNAIMATSFLGRMDQFLIGMLAADAARRHGDFLKRHASWLFLTSFAAAYVALGLLARHASIYGPPKNWLWCFWPTIEALLWSAVIVSYVAWRPTLPQRLDRWLQRGGELSYSLYMLHCLAIYALFHAFGLVAVTGRLRLDLALNFVPVLLLSLGLAHISHRIIEQPFMSLRRRYLQPSGE